MLINCFGIMIHVGDVLLIHYIFDVILKLTVPEFRSYSFQTVIDLLVVVKQESHLKALGGREMLVDPIMNFYLALISERSSNERSSNDRRLSRVRYIFSCISSSVPPYLQNKHYTSLQLVSIVISHRSAMPSIVTRDLMLRKNT